MTTTLINTDLTATQTLDGFDTLFLRAEGSIITGGSDAISMTGDRNTVFVDGLIASPVSGVIIFSGEGSSVSIGQSGRLVSLSTGNYSIYDTADNSAIYNHGQISANYAIGLAGTNTTLTNTGLIEGIGAYSIYEAGVTLRGSATTIVNSGDIFGTNFAVATGGFSATDTVIENSGQITGEVGLSFTGGSGLDLDNSGTITGSQGTAILVSFADTNILNTGTINGDVVFQGTDAFIKNTGDILGNVILDDSGSYYKGARDGWVSGGVYGDVGNDTIYGASDFDYIEGGAGDDTVRGRAGNDRIFGEEGNDTIRGNDGDDEIEGNQDDDLLYGGRGDDTITGGSGNDTITGGAGNDLLSGKSGADVFVFNFTSGIDEITDFKNNTDKLDLSKFDLSSRQDLTDAGAILENGAGSMIDLTAVGGDGLILVEDMSVAQWGNSDFIF